MRNLRTNKTFLTAIAIAGLALCANAQNYVPVAELTPDADVFQMADRAGAKAFRILPRGLYDGQGTARDESDYPLKVRGGGAYYSFTSQHHSYNKIPQIELQQNNFSSGFYGANYGFLIDLGGVQLSAVTNDRREVREMLRHRYFTNPRADWEKTFKIQSGGVTFQRSVPAVAGHAYLLRSISYDEADIAVAFYVVSKLANGGYDIIWKKLETFPTPEMIKFTDAEVLACAKGIVSATEFAKIKPTLDRGVLTFIGTVTDSQKADISKRAQICTTGGIAFKPRAYTGPM